MSFDWIAGDKITADRLNQIDSNTDSRIGQNEHNVLQLYLENFFSSKVTPFLGLFFDGFSDETKTDVLTDIEIDAGNKQLKFQVPSALAILNTGSDKQDSGISVTQTVPHTIAVGNRRLLIVAAGTGGGTSISGVTFNGVAMTRIDSVSKLSGDLFDVYLLFAPNVGTHDIVITYSNSAVDQIMFRANFVNAKQSAQFGVEGQASKPADLTPSQIFTTEQDGSIALMWIYKDGEFVTGVDAGQTQIGSFESNDINKGFAFSSEAKATAGSMEMGYTVANAGSFPAFLGFFEILEDQGTDATSGSYESVITAFQQSMETARLWIVRNFTAQFNLDSAISGGATTLTIAGDQTGKFANGDTIDISTSDNLTRERKTLTAVPTFGGGVTTLTFSATANAFGTSAFAERVDVIPQVSLVNSGDAKSFQSLTFQRSEVDFANSEVEDEYLLTLGTPQEDLKIKVDMTRNDITLVPVAKRLGVVVNT